MPDSYQIIVDRDVSEDDAKKAGRCAIEWLIDEFVIEEVSTRCVPDSASRGHRPASGWQRAIVEIDERFLELDTNGVHLEVGRRVFDAGQYQPVPYCPACDQGHRPDAQWERALSTWRSGDDEAQLVCPRCETPAPITDWRHDPPIGLGHLGIYFWNWPSLNREFIERLAAELGHRLLLVEGLAPE